MTPETIHLTDTAALHAAEEWLRAHGLESAQRHDALTDRALLLPVGRGWFQVARLGQWLVLDEAGVVHVRDEPGAATRCGRIRAVTAEPIPEPTRPATAEDLGHHIHQPLRVDDQWRALCRCHWWTPVVAPWWAEQ